MLYFNEISKASELEFEANLKEFELDYEFDLIHPLPHISLHHPTALPERAIKPRILERLDMRESRFYFLSSECTTFRGIFLHISATETFLHVYTPHAQPVIVNLVQFKL